MCIHEAIIASHLHFEIEVFRKSFRMYSLAHLRRNRLLYSDPVDFSRFLAIFEHLPYQVDNINLQNMKNRARKENAKNNLAGESE